LKAFSGQGDGYGDATEMKITFRVIPVIVIAVVIFLHRVYREQFLSAGNSSQALYSARTFIILAALILGGILVVDGDWKNRR
jgi:type IV secretory pathway VirB6-like protein